MLELIEKILESYPKERVRYRCWVKKINERMTVQDRLIVVGDVHVFTLKQTLMKSGHIARVGHLFDIESLEASTNELCIKFPTFKIRISAKNINRLVKEIRDAHGAISYGSPEGHSFKITLPPEYTNYIPLVVSDDVAFMSALNAWSQYHLTPPTPDLLEYCKQSFETGRKELVIGSMSEEQFIVLCSVLKYDTYWTSIVVEDGDQFPLLNFSSTLRYNQCITDISITNVQKQWDFFQSFGESLMRNKGSKVSCISLINTPLANKGVKAISEAIRLQLPIQMLHLESCEMSGDEIKLLVDGLANKMANLESLSLSNNQIKSDGTAALISTITNAKNLKQIFLSNTDMDFSSFFYCLVSSSLPSLERIDISDNRLTEIDVRGLNDLIVGTDCLSIFEMQNCKLNSNMVASIIAASSKNGHDVLFTFDFSRNDLSEEIASLTTPIKKATSLKGLRLDRCGLNDDGLQLIFDACNDAKCLKSLSVSQNLKAALDYDSKKTRVHTARALATLVEGSNQLKTLIIAGSRGNQSTNTEGGGEEKFHFAFGPALGKALTSFSKNKTISSLDISYNDMGNEGAKTLAQAMQNNRCLTSLLWDGNQIELDGYEKFLSCIKKNSRLSRVPFPVNDSKRFQYTFSHVAAGKPVGTSQGIATSRDPSPSPQQQMAHSLPGSRDPSPVPTRDLSGTSVPSTGVVRDARAQSVMVQNVLMEISNTTESMHEERKIKKAIMLEQEVYKKIRDGLVKRELDALYMMNVLEECLTIINDTRSDSSGARREKEIQGLVETISAGGYPAEMFFGEEAVEKMRTFLVKSRLFDELMSGENVISYSDYSDLSENEEETVEFEPDK